MRSPYTGAGLEMYQCPLSYGFYENADLMPNTSALLLEAYADRKLGMMPAWGQASALYQQAMHLIDAYRAEREAEQIEAMKPKKPIK